MPLKSVLRRTGPSMEVGGFGKTRRGESGQLNVNILLLKGLLAL